MFNALIPRYGSNFTEQIKETYRFHSAIGVGYPRVAPSGGITIGDTFFAEGVISCLKHLHFQNWWFLQVTLANENSRPFLA